MISPDPRPLNLINRLRGYTQRQTWMTEDSAIIQEFFDVLDEQHVIIQGLKSDLALLDQVCRDYEQQIKFMEGLQCR